MAGLDPSHIVQVGTGFWGAKALLSAVELGMFTMLGRGTKTAEEIRTALKLSSRAVPDFPDALVALGVLDREGQGPEARYRNTPEAAAFLHKHSPHYIGGILEMANDRLYGFWANLTEALRTGQPQNEIKDSGEPVLAKLHAQPERLEQFMNAMVGISAGNFKAFADKFDFTRYATLCDVGGGTGQLACMVAHRHPRLGCTTFDSPAVEALARGYVGKAGVADRVKVVTGDLLEDDLPKADVVTMGMVLRNWNLEKKKLLIRKAYDALPEGGALVAIEALIDDQRRKNSFALLGSLNMLIESGDAFDFTAQDFRTWCTEVGFRTFDVIDLPGPSSAAVAYK